MSWNVVQMRFYINSFRSSFKDIILNTKLQHCGQWLYTQSDRSVLSSEYLILEFEGNYQFLFYFLAAFFHKNLLVYIFCQYGGIISNKLKRTQCWRSLSKSFYIVKESIVKNILSNILCPVSLVLGSQIPGPGSWVLGSGVLSPWSWVLGPHFTLCHHNHVLGHILIHSLDETRVLAVTVELIWLQLLNILSLHLVPTPKKSLLGWQDSEEAIKTALLFF